MVASKPEGLDGKGGSSYQGRCDQNLERENREERGRKHKQKGEKGQPKEEVMEERRKVREKVKRHGEDKVPEQGRALVHTEETDLEDESQRQSGAAPKPGTPVTCHLSLCSGLHSPFPNTSHVLASTCALASPAFSTCG